MNINGETCASTTAGSDEKDAAPEKKARRNSCLGEEGIFAWNKFPAGKGKRIPLMMPGSRRKNKPMEEKSTITSANKSKIARMPNCVPNGFKGPDWIQSPPRTKTKNGQGDSKPSAFRKQEMKKFHRKVRRAAKDSLRQVIALREMRRELM